MLTSGSGCEVCKPALSYMLDMLWCGDHDEDRSARFINDRVHANIQKDGTFSVIPRIRGGVTSPDEPPTESVNTTPLEVASVGAVAEVEP